jgi:carboxylesterase type B
MGLYLPTPFSNIQLIILTHQKRGGLYSGSGAGNNLTNFVFQASAAGKPLIAVSLNYRLTAFGFLWGSEELKQRGSANNGLRDQRLALHWIQGNIIYFGGDPSKVTIFGQSAGGLSVGKQLIAYGGRDDRLFRGAIMQSGGVVEKWPYNIRDPAAYTEDLYRNLTETTGCSSQTSPLDCLRGLPVETLPTALNVSYTPVFPSTGLGPWLTQVDGDFLQDGPTESLNEHHFLPVPVIYTTTADEATVFGYGGKVDSDEDFRAFVAGGGPDDATVAIIESLYPNDDSLGLPAGYFSSADDVLRYGSQWKRSVVFHTDVVETASRRKTVESWAEVGATAYAGLHDLMTLNLLERLGSHHSVELNFVFNNVATSNYNTTGLQRTSIILSRMWTSFVSDLDPNNHGGKFEWPVLPQNFGW